jgi:formate--tetrahydrofolate ligase
VKLAHAVVHRIDTTPAKFRPLYPDHLSLWEKARTIAREIYKAADIAAEQSIKDRFAELERGGFGHLPICIAKTQFSFTTDPSVRGAPSGHIIPLRELRLSAGAEFVVVICGDITTMPGLPRSPAANNIQLTSSGSIIGLF